MLKIDNPKKRMISEAYRHTFRYLPN